MSLPWELLHDEQGFLALRPRDPITSWRITDAVQRIWAGERDWHALAEDLDRNSALLVLRVLETLAEQG